MNSTSSSNDYKYGEAVEEVFHFFSYYSECKSDKKGNYYNISTIPIIVLRGNNTLIND